MAKNMQPVLKRCRTLGIEPSVMGIDKSSNRTFNQRRKKQSEYGMQLNEKQKSDLYMAFWKNSSQNIMLWPQR